MQRCLVNDCNLPYRCKGYCGRHYDKLRNNGDPEYAKPKFIPKKCSMWDCTDNATRRGYCHNHYNKIVMQHEPTKRRFITESQVKLKDKPLWLFGRFFLWIERNQRRLENDRATYIPKSRNGQKGHKHTEQYKQLMAELHRGRNNPMWRGGLWVNGLSEMKEHLRKLAQYRDWRTAVYRRDNYTCQRCGARGGGTYLEAHHLIPFIELIKRYNIRTLDEALACTALWDISNGATLCSECHGILPKAQGGRGLKQIT